MGVRSRRIQRILSAMPVAQKLRDYTKEVHQGATFHINRREMEGMWYATPFMRTRDSGALEESNFQVIYGDLTKRLPETVSDHRFGHWGCGWFERVYVRADDAPAIKAVGDWIDALADYPIADEQHYSETEWEMNHPSDRECYAEDSEDCSCPVGVRLREIEAHSCLIEFACAVWAPGDKEEYTEIDESDNTFYCDYCGTWTDQTSDMLEILAMRHAITSASDER